MRDVSKSLKYFFRFSANMTLGKFHMRAVTTNVHYTKRAPASLFNFNVDIESRNVFHRKQIVMTDLSFLRETLVSQIKGSIRKYAPNTSNSQTHICWNCKELVENKNGMLCSKCGRLQDIHSSINFFDLLEFPPTFDIKLDQLTRRFRQMQTLVHPDKFSNKSEREQKNSADWSSLINKAYKTLSIPIERGQYLLKLQGIQIPQDNSALDSKFLLEMMERNEEIEEASNTEELNKLNDVIIEDIEQQIKAMSKAFADNDWDGAKSFLVKMKYFLSMQRTLKTKLQSIS